MKKRSSAKPAPKTVDEYLARVPEPARTTLQKVRATIRSAAPPDTTEGISYGMPMFKSTEILIWYAAFSGHCSLFPKMSVIQTFKDELKNYRISKGTIQFPVDKPFPATLLKKIVKARLAENAHKRAR